MDLPDCPPGAEGYEDSVVEVPKKPTLEDTSCTKAEQEFQEHLNSLKIKVENGEYRCMVERRGRDVSGKWIYLCYPCAAVCSGETILQTHISGKKHKSKLALRNLWPLSIFEEHPYILTEKGVVKEKAEATEKVLQKMAEEVKYHNDDSDLDKKYNKCRGVRCHIQDSIDQVKAPLVGLEYLVEHPPEEAHYEPSYVCTLCSKHGHPRTIINHLTCFWHRYHYLSRHFPRAGALLAPYRGQQQYREGVGLVTNRLVQRIEDKYGRLLPVNIDKEEYEKDRDRIHQWIYKGPHFGEKEGFTFEEVVDTGLIESLNKSNMTGDKFKYKDSAEKKDPSPPVVAAPSRPQFNSYPRPRHERRISTDALSDISDELDPRRPSVAELRYRGKPGESNRFDPYRNARNDRFTKKNRTAAEKNLDKIKPPNYEYKQKLAQEQRQVAEESAKKTLAYHEKNPEKHPLYPEEWKKFWNRRYKEIQAEGKDPSKHDFKPEWITYWTARMKQLHQEELRTLVTEIYRKMCLPLPDLDAKPDARLSPERPRRPSEPRRRSPDPRDRRRSPDARRQSPDVRRRSPNVRRRSPEPRRPEPPRRRTPDLRRRSPDHRRRSPDFRRHTPDRRRSPDRWRPVNDRFNRDHRPSPGRHKSIERRPSPPRHSRPRSRSPRHRSRSAIRTNIQMDSIRRSHSPLSRRDATAALRNRSPARAAPDVAPSMQTVLISDEEFRPDDSGLSPWDSDNEDSFGSLPDTRTSRAGSEMSRQSRGVAYARPAPPADLGPAENVVATLRLLVALEDYLGSLGPKIVDLLTDALRMEKEQANSSEDILERESALVLIETAKEKLKGAVQAGLVAPAAAPAVRAAVVRAAATLHEADTRARHKAQSESMPAPDASARGRKRTRTRPRTRRRPRRGPPGEQKSAKQKPASVPVAGVGEVDRAQIAQQMAAALIAQGKTDVSSDELAQLVDAVVGMAEAKKREAENKKKAATKPVQPKPKLPLPSTAFSGTASALQMLQSAYDENEKKLDKDEKDYTPDAMDGLSDSDLETLLKNFNELSAEEQHSLIAYLKKLEAREPQRVERLRQYVSAAANSTAPAEEPAPQNPNPDTQPVTIESDDDDDYTVDEVFQSATQKVKEDQIRQEMEIVKKSLKETTKEVTPTATPEPSTPIPTIDLSKHMSSATDLLALVQASIQSTAANPPTASAAPADVVASHTQPRSFGDLPEASMASNDTIRTIPSIAEPVQNFSQPKTDNFNENNQNWNSRPISNIANERSVLIPGGPYGSDNRGPYNQDNQGSFNQDNRDPFDQDNRGSFNEDNRAPFGQDNRGGFNQDNRPPFNQGNRGPYNQDHQGSFNQDSRGPFNQDTHGSFNQDSRGPFNQDTHGSYNQDSRGPFNQDTQGSFNQDSRGPFNQDTQGSFNQDSRGSFNQDNQGSFHQDNRAPVNQDSRGNFNQDNRASHLPGNRAPVLPDTRSQGTGFPMHNNWGTDNRGGYNPDNRSAGSRGGAFDNQYNQGNAGNFMNGGGMQGNKIQPQYGNYDSQKNFRGRGGRGGGGQFGGHKRGRGRGGYY